MRQNPLFPSKLNFAPGDRVRLSELGRERCPKLPTAAGVVAGFSGVSAVQVLFPSRKTVIKLHASYVAKVEDEQRDRA